MRPDESAAFIANIQQTLAEWQQAVVDIEVALCGGFDAWKTMCRQRFVADPDNRMARIICRILRQGGDAQRINRCDRHYLEVDKPLAAYWRSVAEDRDGIFEERRRFSQHRRKAATAFELEERLQAMPIPAAKALLPVWRAWGRVIMGTEISVNSASKMEPMNRA